MAVLEFPHLELDEDGTLLIAGTRFKALQLIREHLAYGWDAPELQQQHPQFTLSQVHSALGHYYDHCAEFDLELRQRDELVEELRARQPDSPVRRKLRASGQLP
ncbi:MAG: hypothetical protein ACKV2Q_28260 [Planctomycetaceae bacterium]